jgi:hypothetical protein
MPKVEFAQAYCQDPLKEDYKEIYFRFSKLYFIFYVFLKSTQISENLKHKRVGKKE